MAMTMNRRELVKVFWEQLDNFIRDWQKNPFRWDNERSIQFEIANRIKSAYGIRNDLMHLGYDYKLGGRFEKEQVYSRVRFEQKIYIKRRRQRCCPDIVIYDTINNPKLPPDSDWRKRINFPMLMVCEIKFRPVWKKGYRPKTKDNWDLEKLKSLLKRKDVRHGCWLNISCRRASSGNGFSKPTNDCGVKVYDIELPSLKK